MHELLEQTEYTKVAGQISEQDIYEELSVNPEFADDWLEYSENKRTDGGWFFKQDDKNKFLVGRIDKTRITQTEYEDKIKACAKFIKQELDAITR